MAAALATPTRSMAASKVFSYLLLKGFPAAKRTPELARGRLHLALQTQTKSISTSDQDGITLPTDDDDGYIGEAIELDPRDWIDKTPKNHSTLTELEELPIMHVRCTFNNTHVTICDSLGQVLGWKSAGSEGYKNARRGTTFAAQAAGVAAAAKAKELGIREIRVKLKGPGAGRQYSLKGFEQGGLLIRSIQDVTPVPHNGCRPRKKRRV